MEKHFNRDLELNAKNYKNRFQCIHVTFNYIQRIQLFIILLFDSTGGLRETKQIFSSFLQNENLIFCNFKSIKKKNYFKDHNIFIDFRLLLLLQLKKKRPFKVLFIFGNRKNGNRSHRHISGKYGDWGFATVFFLAKNSLTNNEV